MSEALLSTTGLSFERLRAFLEIATARGISRAANGNPNRQSQLSRQLSELETFFGAPLVNRGHGIPFGLTDSGRRLKAIAAQQFAAFEELKQQAMREPLSIRVGAGEVVLTWLVIPTLAAVGGLAGNLHLSLLNRRSADVIAGVLDGALEIGIIHREPSKAGLRGEPLGAIAKVLVKPAALKHLSGDALPLAVMEDLGRDEQIPSDAQPAVDGEATFFCSSYQQMRELVSRGCCAAVLPHFIVREFSRNDFHVEPLPSSKGAWHLQAIFNPKLLEHRPAAAKAVRELTAALRKLLSSQRYSS